MEYTNSRRIKWYLHVKKTIIGRNKISVSTYFFKKKKDEGYCDLPIGYTVKETPSGLPVIKKLSS